MGKNPELRRRILREFMKRDDWISVTKMCETLGKDYTYLDRDHLQRLSNQGILEVEYPERNREKPLKSYRLRRNVEVYRKVAEKFLDSPNQEYPILLVGSKYHKTMCVKLLNEFLASVGLETIDPHLPGDYAQALNDLEMEEKEWLSDETFQRLMFLATKYPSFLELVLNGKIDENVTQAVAMKALGREAIKLDVESAPTQLEVKIGLIGIGKLCAQLDMIKYPKMRALLFERIKDTRKSIEAWGRVFDEIGKIFSRDEQLKKRLREVRGAESKLEREEAYRRLLQRLEEIVDS